MAPRSDLQISRTYSDCKFWTLSLLSNSTANLGQVHLATVFDSYILRSTMSCRNRSGLEGEEARVYVMNSKPSPVDEIVNVSRSAFTSCSLSRRGQHGLWWEVCQDRQISGPGDPQLPTYGTLKSLSRQLLNLPNSKFPVMQLSLEWNRSHKRETHDCGFKWNRSSWSSCSDWSRGFDFRAILPRSLCCNILRCLDVSSSRDLLHFLMQIRLLR